MTNKSCEMIIAAHPDDEIVGCGGAAAIHDRSPENIDALAKFRGTSIGAAVAESFMLVRKIIA